MRLARPLTVLAVLAGLGSPVSGFAQTPPAADDPPIVVPLPEPPLPVVTDGGQWLNFGIVLPEPPPDVVIIAVEKPADEAQVEEAQVVVPLPELPPADIALLAPVTETGALPDKPADQPASASPQALASVILPAPAPPAETEPLAGTLPAETVRAAIQRLKGGNRLTDAEAGEALAFYEARGFDSLWVKAGQWNDTAKALRARLALAGEEGLDAARYRTVAAFHSGGEPFWPALAAAEAQLTEALILYAREASTGRVRPQQVNPLITPRLQKLSARAVLTALVDSSDPAAALQAFNPPHAQYVALRQHLARAKANRPIPIAGDPIPEGPVLRPGMRDPRVPLIRARLGLGYDTEAVYDRKVSIKVASLQRDAGLPADGIFTPQTRLAMLGEGPGPEELEILANMEFWRWMPRDLGPSHILVIVPALGMTLNRNGSVIHEARVIVGKEQTQTPFFSDLMDHVVVNPSWYVPPGIMKREPKYRDPDWAAANGYEIRSHRGYTSVRMPPGASNALGYIKFMFPNEHSVYLHDTPKRTLFNARNRALSNGCVRVENPFQLAALLMASDGWTEERLRSLIGRGERTIKLAEKMPIHLAYFTLTTDASGNLQRHPDIYGHSQRLKQLVGLP